MIVITIGRQIIMKNNFSGRICKCRSLMGRSHDNVEKKKVVGERFHKLWKLRGNESLATLIFIEAKIASPPPYPSWNVLV
jgi:hypothetical protein